MIRLAFVAFLALLVPGALMLVLAYRILKGRARKNRERIAAEVMAERRKRACDNSEFWTAAMDDTGRPISRVTETHEPAGDSVRLGALGTRFQAKCDLRAAELREQNAKSIREVLDRTMAELQRAEEMEPGQAMPAGRLYPMAGPNDPACNECGADLLFSARQRGNGLCGWCTANKGLCTGCGQVKDDSCPCVVPNVEENPWACKPTCRDSINGPHDPKCAHYPCPCIAGTGLCQKHIDQGWKICPGCARAQDWSDKTWPHTVCATCIDKACPDCCALDGAPHHPECPHYRVPDPAPFYLLTGGTCGTTTLTHTTTSDVTWDPIRGDWKAESSSGPSHPLGWPTCAVKPEGWMSTQLCGVSPEGLVDFYCRPDVAWMRARSPALIAAAKAALGQS